MEAFATLSLETKVEIAGQLALSDAVERGLTPDKAEAFFKSKTFENAVRSYLKMM